MFARKVFELYSYQRQISALGINRDFSRQINRHLGGEALQTLDGLFYLISTDRVADPEALAEALKYERRNPVLSSLKQNIDWLTATARDIVAREMLEAAAEF
jgi:hypothetical protein